MPRRRLNAVLICAAASLAAAAPDAASPPSASPAPSAQPAPAPDKAASATAASAAADKADAAAAGIGTFKPEEVGSDGSVRVGGTAIDYHAVAGTVVVHPKDWDDVPSRGPTDTKSPAQAGSEQGENNPTAEASMFFVAYFRKGAAPETRPITFVFNGGPGSSTVWLHMGAFGPRRVVTLDDQHTPAAPYRVVDNAQSLLDATDLVFIDAPGAGFSRIAGHDKEKAFWGVDPDAEAFAGFITSFLSRYGRWNSPKYLFGESYGTTRSAVLSNLLGNDRSIDLNGVILLSQILNFSLNADNPTSNPGVDQPYVLALPSFAATAWYHHKLPGNPPDLDTLLPQVEAFATGPYLHALERGSELPTDERDQVAAQLHAYTGLPEAYLKKAQLRIEGGMFEKMLLDDTDDTTGRLDSRFSGPSLDPLSKEADYDPQSSAISSAYVGAFNDYVRRTLHYGQDKTYKPEVDVGRAWEFKHKQPGGDEGGPGVVNVMPDLAMAMKTNPTLHVMLNAGYFDLATPFFEGVYEMHHLPIPARLQGNIEYKLYQSGHMVYAHEQALGALHDNVADFIRRTSQPKQP